MQVAHKDQPAVYQPNCVPPEVRKVPYYHGMIPLKDALSLTQKDGDFLLRKTETKQGIVLAIQNFIVGCSGGEYYLDKSVHSASTIAGLLKWYVDTQNPVSAKCQVRLVRPIPRQAWQIAHDTIELGRKIGEGAYGSVFLAVMIRDSRRVPVAVKSLKHQVSREARLDFMREARVMRRFKHPNIVQIVGIACHELPIMLAMEICEGGSLLSYLRKHRDHLAMSEKLRFIEESALGLRYLESLQCQHRDIAARNCLLSADKTVKISDFGLSTISPLEYHRVTDVKLPVPWLAPEVLKSHAFNRRSDTWSFGVMMWEILTEGEEPFKGKKNVQVYVMVVVQGYRLPLPENTPRQICAVVDSCWRKEPDTRPSFDLLVQFIQDKRRSG